MWLLGLGQVFESQMLPNLEGSMGYYSFDIPYGGKLCAMGVLGRGRGIFGGCGGCDRGLGWSIRRFACE